MRGLMRPACECTEVFFWNCVRWVIHVPLVATRVPPVCLSSRLFLSIYVHCVPGRARRGGRMVAGVVCIGSLSLWSSLSPMIVVVWSRRAVERVRRDVRTGAGASVAAGREAVSREGGGEEDRAGEGGRR